MNNRFFIPHVVEVLGVKVPSTPFNLNEGEPLFLGDVFEVINTEENSKDVFVAELKDGQYVGLTKNGNDVPIWILEPSDVKVIGSSVEKPELLELLTD